MFNKSTSLGSTSCDCMVTGELSESSSTSHQACSCSKYAQAELRGSQVTWWSGRGRQPEISVTPVTHLSESQIPSYQWKRKNVCPVLQLPTLLGGFTLSYINSSFIYNIQNLERSQMAINSWISKWWYICTMSEPLIHMTTWKNLKIIRLSERNQTPRSASKKKKKKKIRAIYNFVYIKF